MHNSFHAFIRHIRGSDLSLSQVNTLFWLYHHGYGSVNDLAEHLGVTKAAVSQLLDSLLEAELVVRSENPEDRRMKLIALTDKGRCLVRKSMKTRHAWLSDLVQEFSDEEKEEILPTIQMLNQRVQVFNAELDHHCKHQNRKCQKRNRQ
ncbi:MarR family transcriptional regulator [Chloroflexota bacterium]|nr:MarR family transcriptional regulator [Chloroflexota bacterium]